MRLVGRISLPSAQSPPNMAFIAFLAPMPLANYPVSPTLSLRHHIPSSCLPSPPSRVFGQPTLLPRRAIGLYELTRAGVDPYRIFADGSSRNDAVFGGAVFSVVLAVLGGATVAPDAVEGTVGGVVGLALAVWAADALLLESSIARVLSGAVKDAERAALHEAGHFLVAYLCGVRIAGYEMRGEAGVELDFDGKEDVWVCAAIGMGGIAAECLIYGKAEGGGEDLKEVKGIIRDRGGGLGAGEEGIGRVARWGLLQAVLLLNKFDLAHKRLAEGMREGRSVEECCEIIEALCSTDEK